jgi:DNA polymerase-1
LSIKFLVVDGNSMACRAAFAHNSKMGPDLMTSTGRLTGATLRFFNMFDKVLHLVRPTHIVVAWDVDHVTFRNALDESYKGNREHKDDSLHIQFSDIKKILTAIGINNVGVQGYEADDIIGTYVTLSNADKTYIVSGDRDSFQLVNDKTCVIYPLHGFTDIEFITPDYVLQKYEVPVDKFVDLKALMGDSGDNVRGIDNCGEKTAAKLINHYGSAESVANNAETIDLKGINKNVKAGIMEWAPRSNIVKQLVTIRKDVPVPYDFNECQVKLNWKNAENIFKELEFSSLIKKLRNGEFYANK